MSENAERPARNTYTPWKVSVSYALVGLLLTGMLFLFPSLRWLHLPGGTTIPVPFIVMVIPLISLGWAIFGIARRRIYRGLIGSLLGLIISLTAIAYNGVAFWTDELRQDYLERVIPALAPPPPAPDNLQQNP